MLDWTLHLLNHPWIPWAAVGFLLFWGSGHWIAMQRNFFWPLHRQLFEARQQLEETPEEPIAFAAHYHEVERTLSRFRLLAPSWTAFSRTLFFSSRGMALQGSREPRHFLSATALMGGESSRYYYHTVPSLLLGVGVLFTLIGLVAAIRFTILGMASNDLHTTQNALQGLLNAASLKFLSSIVGFAIAVLFSWEEKRQSHILGQEAERFCQLLLERISFAGEEEIRREQLRETQVQSKHLKEISDRLNQSATQPMFQQSAGKQGGDASSDVLFQRFATKLEETMDHFRETLVDLGKTIKTVSAPSPDLQGVIQSIQGEGERLIHANETVLARLFEGINRQLSSLHVDSSLAELQPAERTELLDRLADRMETAVINLGDAGLSPFQSIATQIEKAIIALESRATERRDGVTLPDIERLIGALREEGERVWAANAWNSEKYGVEAVHENLLPLQTVYSGEQTDLLERIALQMEQVVRAFGQQAGSQTDLSPVSQEQTALLERIAAQIEQAVTVLIATAGGAHLDAGAQSDWLERSAQMEQAIVASLVAKAESFNALETLQPLLESVQQGSERLIQANAAAMEKLLDGVQQQFASMQAEAVMSELLPDERTRIMDHLATRMETVLSNLGTAGLSPFDRIATQLEKAVLALEEKSAVSGMESDMRSIVETLREEGARVVAANEGVVERMVVEISRHGSSGLSYDSNSREQAVILEHVAAQIERAIVTLGEKVESSSSQSRMEALLEGMRQEGERLVRANEEAMHGMLEVITHRFSEATATATLSELDPEERSGLLDRVTSRMEQAVSSLGEVGLSPFFEEIRREMAQVTGSGSQVVNEGLLESFSRMTRQLDGVVAALENKVWAADVMPDMTPLVRAIRQEGERLLMANDQAMDRLLTEMMQRVPAVGFSPDTSHSSAILAHIAAQLEKISQALTDKSVASSAVFSDLDPLFSRIQREGERLVQANQHAMAGLLDEVARRFAGVTASSALAELYPNERSELLDGVAMRMDRAVTSLGELGLTPFFDGMRQEVEQLVRSNQHAVSQLLEEITQRNREQGSKEAQLLESVVTQVSNSIAQMGDKWSAVLSPVSDRHTVPDALITTIQKAADRLHENHQHMFAQLERVLERVAVIQSPTVVSAPPMGEIVAILDEQSLRPLIDGWRQEGERMVMASEMAFERLLEEVGQRLSHARAGEEMALFERLSTQLDHSLSVVSGATPLKESATTEEESAVGPLQQGINRVTVSETSAILAPFLSEMTQIMSRQRNEEMRMMKHVATEVSRSVAALDAKIGRATPLNLRTLVNTVHEQGEKLFASSQQILQQLQMGTTPMVPALSEMIYAVSQQRGEEMRLLERVATEVHRSVAALDAKIGRATPLDLKTLLHTVQDQGEKLCASGQEIVRALHANPGDRLGSRPEKVPAPPMAMPVDKPSQKVSPSAEISSVMILSPADIFSRQMPLSVDPSVTLVHSADQAESNTLPTGNEGLHALLASLPVRSPSRNNGIPTQPVVKSEISSVPSLFSHPWVQAPSSSVPIMRPTKVGSPRMPWVSMAADVFEPETEEMELPTVSDLLPKLLANRAKGSQDSQKTVAKHLLALTDRSHFPAEVNNAVTVANRLDIQPLVPKLVGDFRDRRRQPRLPFIEFVDHQTADFFDSHARFSVLKP